MADQRLVCKAVETIKEFDKIHFPMQKINNEVLNWIILPSNYIKTKHINLQSQLAYVKINVITIKMLEFYKISRMTLFVTNSLS